MEEFRKESERLMRESLELRHQAVRKWRFGTPEATTCPLCFGATITVLFTDGYEHLKCAECGVEGPLYASPAA